ncbi:MAG: MFS transporter [Bacteroidia bacterium]|nr:MFS transporter [Bacteroidia bacterium]
MKSKYSIQFWLLCLSTLLFFLSFNIIIPEMPDYISSLGGEDYKGYIIGVFTIAAALSRPVSGKLADTIGRLPVMIFGGLVCVVISFLYPLFTTVFGFLALRALHGLSTGFMPTGTVAYLADIIPSDRRGEAMGLLGIMNNVGFMAGNAMSSILTGYIGVSNVFIVAGVLSVFSVAIVLRMKETLPVTKRFKLKHLLVNTDDVWDKRAINPAIVMVLTVTTFGALLTLIPDYSKHLGIDNKGLFLSVMTVSTIITRLFTSKLSDKIGRAKSCLIGTSFWIISTLLLTTINLNAFYLAGITCGIASGINSPAIFAWAVDVADGVRSGRAMATLFIALEIGISVGSFGSAAIYGNVPENFIYVFLAISLINVLALAYVISIRKSTAPSVKY